MATELLFCFLATSRPEEHKDDCVHLVMNIFYASIPKTTS